MSRLTVIIPERSLPSASPLPSLPSAFKPIKDSALNGPAPDAAADSAATESPKFDFARPTEKRRYDARQYFLTYPKCGDKEGVFHFLKTVGTGANSVTFVQVVKETHEDDTPHLHAFLQFSTDRTINLKSDCRIFDYCVGAARYHPNIQLLADPEATLEYFAKEDKEPLTFGTPRLKRKAKSDDRSEDWRSLLAQPSREEFFKAAECLKPRDFVLNYEKLEYFARERYATNVPYENPFDAEDFKLPAEVKTWLKEEFIKTERAKCLCLIGPSRYGKTAWARSLGHHIFMRGQTNLEKWSDDARYIVLDDIGWKFVAPSAKQLLTAMGEVDLTDKYRKKVTKVNYLPAIYLTNRDPREEMDAGDVEYWEANMSFVTLQRPLFNGNAITLEDRRQVRNFFNLAAQVPDPAPTEPDWIVLSDDE